MSNSEVEFGEFAFLAVGNLWYGLRLAGLQWLSDGFINDNVMELRE